MRPLPIDAELPKIQSALARQGALILQAETGAGKTTRVPPALWPAHPQRLTVLVEPRRVAVRAAARRIAEEQNCPLGTLVGYQVRLERVASSQTRCLVLTPGVLLRMIQDDPFLESVGLVLLDEFHERSLETDLALAMIRYLRETVRPELQLVVMSATIQAEPLADYLGGCPILRCPGRSFPVAIQYRPRRTEVPWPVATAQALEAAWTPEEGDVLIFVPGRQDIEDTLTELESFAQRMQARLLPLHGDLPPEAQDLAIRPQPYRKWIVSTNVAETSVTIDGVTLVIDTGRMRTLEYDANLGLDRLVTRPIPQSAAEQRAGRAGRTGPGRCIRLWDAGQQSARPLELDPEILRVDLSGACLWLASVGEADASKLPWLTPPPARHVAQAYDLLQRLRAWG